MTASLRSEPSIIVITVDQTQTDGDLSGRRRDQNRKIVWKVSLSHPRHRPFACSIPTQRPPSSSKSSYPRSNLRREAPIAAVELVPHGNICLGVAGMQGGTRQKKKRTDNGLL